MSRRLLPFLIPLVVTALFETRLSADASRLLTVSPQSFLETCRADIGMAKAAAERLKASKPADGLLALDDYDTATGALTNTKDRAGLAWNVHPDAALRESATRCESEVDSAKTELSLDGRIFEAIERLDLTGADGATHHYVERMLRDFRLAGVDKDEPTRARIKALRDELVTLGQEFGSNVAADVRSIEVDPADLDGLPDDFKRSHPLTPAGKIVLTTNNTDYLPFLTYSRSERAREALWKVYRQRARSNLPILNRMLVARAELARLLGFETWADYVTDDKMIRTRAVAAWDSTYLQEQVKSEKYSFDSQSVRPYFEYNRVKQGVMDLTSRMFGISYRRVSDAAVCHPDVEVFDVLDGSRVLGRIYLDMFQREDTTRSSHWSAASVARSCPRACSCATSRNPAPSPR
jgi:thimet oligopeptidase